MYFYSGLLVERYLGRNVETVLCPARMESLEDSPVAFFSPSRQLNSNYVHRGPRTNLWPKLNRPRQGVMQDSYWVSPNPSHTRIVNHAGGANCLYNDGSVVWHVLPRTWVDNTIESWDQLDSGEFRPRL